VGVHRPDQLDDPEDVLLVLLDGGQTEGVPVGVVYVLRYPAPEDLSGLGVVPDLGEAESEDESARALELGQVLVALRLGRPLADITLVVAVVR
jgi:hypothetical protein